MGSPSDDEHCKKIAKCCKDLGVPCQLRVSSAHKGTEETLSIVAEYEGISDENYIILEDFTGIISSVLCLQAVELKLFLWRLLAAATAWALCCLVTLLTLSLTAHL